MHEDTIKVPGYTFEQMVEMAGVSNEDMEDLDNWINQLTDSEKRQIKRIAEEIFPSFQTKTNEKQPHTQKETHQNHRRKAGRLLHRGQNRSEKMVFRITREKKKAKINHDLQGAVTAYLRDGMQFKDIAERFAKIGKYTLKNRVTKLEVSFLTRCALRFDWDEDEVSLTELQRQFRKHTERKPETIDMGAESVDIEQIKGDILVLSKEDRLNNWMNLDTRYGSP